MHNYIMYNIKCHGMDIHYPDSSFYIILISILLNSHQMFARFLTQNAYAVGIILYVPLKSISSSKNSWGADAPLLKILAIKWLVMDKYSIYVNQTAVPSHPH